LVEFSRGEPQLDDMTALALVRTQGVAGEDQNG